ncbi:MAG TPA: IclR family transcriptional regulator C-terminal domain-containing protein [Shinella sp.]|jgi:IclR family pca regulon transcriptional regulator|uniref:IclR family transcriptional regulator domain-containing protein n=1 Tax=Shinella sp. TaxID=1870904 RepID=UPI0029A01BC2|nr:IclR family transcriptional regulator C-terminal domain-containing protein [Shinella sp.]MDX3975472.1 IclR family transcriptional regulator C-terminal domain-containing protein [Shinella sp.]HEV7247490.1 IclR family transcriptional regulator C-terminal domain-containing protein [Shinella sp.]
MATATKAKKQAEETPLEDENARDYVTSFARGLDVIRTFTRSKPRMTLSEVAEQADMNRAAARRFLLTLVREGYAEFDGKYFGLNPKILELGFSALASMSLPETVQPVLNDLAEKLQESCFCVLLDGDSTVYIAAAKSRRMINVSIELGSRAPAHCMSSGRVLLGSLKAEELDAILESIKLEQITENTVTSKLKLRSAIRDARTKGYSIVDQEYEIGLRSISVPIADRAGHVIAALNVCCPSPRYTLEEMTQKVLPALLDSSSRITLSLPH